MIEPLELEAVGGAVLRGQLRTGGEDGVLLVHDPGRDLDAWAPLAESLCQYRLTVLAIDLAGHGGSDGDSDPSRTETDALLAGRFLRRRVSGHLFVGSAGASAAAALAAAEELGGRGFFALDPQLDAPPRVPALVILPDRGERQQVAARLLREAGAWAVAAQVPVQAEGLDLLASDWAENIRAYVAAFVNDLRATAPAAAARGVR
jgi:pimeloyl-ACP methyl ester carboxylesterase